MKINLQNMQLTAERLQSVLNELKSAKERLTAEYMRLRYNSGVDSVLTQMKKTDKRLEEQIITVMKMKAAVMKISYIYENGEEQIKSVIDCGFVPEKTGFKSRCAITVSTDFDWRIQ